MKIIITLILSAFLLTSCSNPDTSGGVTLAKGGGDHHNNFPYGSCKGPDTFHNQGSKTGCGWISVTDKKFHYIEPNANLFMAYLSGATLSGANLGRANLSGAHLSNANLSYANLQSANLSAAFLYGANLSAANLTEANLDRANLTKANLDGTNLTGATLTGTLLEGAVLCNTTMPSGTVILSGC